MYMHVQFRPTQLLEEAIYRHSNSEICKCCKYAAIAVIHCLDITDLGSSNNVYK